VERIAAVVAKLVCIFVTIGSGKGKCADPLELRKIQGRAIRDAMPMQESRDLAVDLGTIDASIRSCFEILSSLDEAHHAKTPEASAFAKHAGGLADCFPGFTVSDHADRLGARLADARMVLESLEAGKVIRPRDGQFDRPTKRHVMPKQGKALTLWDFVSDGGAAAERLAKERIEHARAEVGAAKRAVDEAASTYPFAFLDELPRLLSIPMPIGLVDAAMVRKRFAVLLDVAASITDGMEVFDVPDEMLDDLAALLGVEREPFFVNANTEGLGELEAVQSSIQELKARLATIEQDIEDPAIDADDRRALAAKRGRLEGNLFDLQHRKMELDVRVVRKVEEQRGFQRAAYLRLLLDRACSLTLSLG
jgi:hypothetical protein